MNEKSSSMRTIVRLVLTGALLLSLVVVIQVFSVAGPASQSTGTATALRVSGTQDEILELPSAGVEGPPPTSAGAPPYPGPPAPTVQPTLAPPEPSPASTAAPMPESPPEPAGPAVTLHDGDLWLVAPGRVPERLTEFGDVAAIFGWSPGGDRLLLGRGRAVQTWGDTTELWLLDANTLEAKQLTTSGLVKTASWSPVVDLVAYCEHENILTVIDLDAKPRHRIERAICDFTWSPDGLAINLPTYTPDMVDSDGLANTVLAVWRFEGDSLQVFSEAKDEVHAWPIWSRDGQRILFHRSTGSKENQVLNGLYVAEVDTGQLRYLEYTTFSARELSRSPRTDLVAYSMEGNILVTDFEGRSEVVAEGHSPLWLPDGQTLLYRTEADEWAALQLDIEGLGPGFAGQGRAPGLYIQPVYFFKPGGD